MEVIDGGPRRRAKGRVDYILRVKVDLEAQPVAVALIEAKAENLPPGHGLEQAKAYGLARRMNVPFVFSSNGHLFVEFDATTGLTSAPRPLPPPRVLRRALKAEFQSFPSFERNSRFSFKAPRAIFVSIVFRK